MRIDIFEFILYGILMIFKVLQVKENVDTILENSYVYTSVFRNNVDIVPFSPVFNGADPSCKDGNPQFTTVLLIAIYDQI